MQNNIIGNGLLARAFSNTIIDNSLIFCSGVSNSQEVQPEAFLREENLLKEALSKHNDKCFIYFSSVAAPTLANLYFKHKINMERLIKVSSNNYLIFRLPYVAGIALNTTLFPTIVENIYLQKKFTVYKNATRTIVDIEDVVEIVNIIAKQSIKNKVINVCPNYFFQPEYLVRLVSKQLGIEPFYDVVNLGDQLLCIQDDSFEGIIISDFFSKKSDYLESVIKKYTPEIVKLINLKQ